MVCVINCFETVSLSKVNMCEMKPIAGSSVPHAETSNIKSLTKTTSGVGLPTAGDQEQLVFIIYFHGTAPRKGY